MVPGKVEGWKGRKAGSTEPEKLKAKKGGTNKGGILKGWPRRVGARKVGPEGWWAKGGPGRVGGAEKVEWHGRWGGPKGPEGPQGVGPKISRFFPLPPIISLLLWAPTRGPDFHWVCAPTLPAHPFTKRVQSTKTIILPIRSTKFGQIRPNKDGQMRPVGVGQVRSWPNSFTQGWPNQVRPSAVTAGGRLS